MLAVVLAFRELSPRWRQPPVAAGQGCNRGAARRFAGHGDRLNSDGVMPQHSMLATACLLDRPDQQMGTASICCCGPVMTAQSNCWKSGSGRVIQKTGHPAGGNCLCQALAILQAELEAIRPSRRRPEDCSALGKPT